MHALHSRIAPVIAVLQRYPRLLAAISFGMGIASFFMVNRQNRSAGLIATILLISWFWLMLENLITDRIARRFHLEIPPALLRYVTQVIHQESFFFVLPFFLVTTTWNSGQPVFIGLLGMAALASIIDPLYYRWLAQRPLVFMIFHTLALFAVLQTALPMILQLTTTTTYEIATAATVILVIPTLLRWLPEKQKWRTGLQMMLIAMALTSLLWVLRFWVPPATVWLVDVHVSSTFDSQTKTPGDAITTLSETELHSTGLYAYTALRAPRGLAESVYHVWTLDGNEVDRIALKIKGGREKGYRTWTHKTVFPQQAVGKWQIQVVTDAGQLIGITRFEVLPDSE